jgi:hypothetical protein
VKDKGFPHGFQHDNIQCGMVAVNSITHAIFEEALWCHEREAIERMFWFEKLAQMYLAKVTSGVIIFAMIILTFKNA